MKVKRQPSFHSFFVLSSFLALLLFLHHLQHVVVEGKTTRDLLKQKKTNQYAQELQTKYEKTIPLEQKLNLELSALENRHNVIVGENCNFIKPSNSTTGWFGINCSILICFGYLPSDLNVCSGYSSCVNPDKCDLAVGDGVYWIKTKSVFKVWCDMSSNGGGWTLIVAQFEADPIGSWAQGLPSTYDPTLQSKKSFTVDPLSIPSHSFTGFGKDLTATTIDYSTFVYSN
ncbi:hypothetical protein ABK040_010600 [Willaertia magna]